MSNPGLFEKARSETCLALHDNTWTMLDTRLTRKPFWSKELREKTVDHMGGDSDQDSDAWIMRAAKYDPIAAITMAVKATLSHLHRFYPNSLLYLVSNPTCSILHLSHGQLSSKLIVV